MSLFHTGFNVDAAVPVASTSTTALPSAGSVHKKRKRATSASLNDNETNDSNKSKSKSAPGSSAAAASSAVTGTPSSLTKNKSATTATTAANNGDVDMSLSNMDSLKNGNSKTVEAVVNIEKLMKKLQRMEKGDSTSDSKNQNKKQKLANGRGEEKTTPAKGLNSIITPKTDKGKGKESETSVAEKAKNKKNKKASKKDSNVEGKPEYVPDAEALAKREARMKKKELYAQQNAAKKAKETVDGNSEAVTGGGDANADASTMDIDTLEEVAQNASTNKAKSQVQAGSEAATPTPVPAAMEESPKKKKKNKKKEAQPEPENGAEVEMEVEAESKPISTAVAPPLAQSTSKKTKTVGPAPAMATKEIDSGMTDLQKRMQKKLGGARFRWINEQLYTTSGVDALQLMEEDPAMFEDYHNGFASQATSWPVQPIHIFIDSFKRLSASKSSNPKPVIADLGCGKAEIAKTLVPLGFTVLSYDLVEEEPYIIKAQCTKRLPLPGASASGAEDNAEGAVVDFVVCCLSLMGSDWLGMIKESRRVLKMNGKLKIAEVTSRFTDVKEFIQLINAMGFKLSSKDESNTHFILFEFEKVPLQTCKSTLLKLPDEEKVELSQDLLKPCIYKRR